MTVPGQYVQPLGARPAGPSGRAASAVRAVVHLLAGTLTVATALGAAAAAAQQYRPGSTQLGSSSTPASSSVGQVPLKALHPDSWRPYREAAVPSPRPRPAAARRTLSPVIRGQSPSEAWEDDTLFAGRQASDAPQSTHLGQVPLRRTDPYSSTGSRRDGYGRQSPVVPAQYTSPTAPPNYVAPPQGSPYAAAPGGSALAEDPFFGSPGGDGQFDGGAPAMPGELIPGPDGSPIFAPEAPLFEPSLDLEGRVTETQTGRIMLGVGVNSNAGVVGNFIIDEQNFDWRRWPSGWEDFRTGQAFRGAGQQFRVEAVPGNQLSRYQVTFREPYLGGTGIALGLSGSFFNRRYRDWDEERLGGRIMLGYQFTQITPDLSGSVALRLENVEVSNPRFPSPPELTRVLGDNGLYSAEFALLYDARDSAFLPTEGGRIKLAFEQAFGDFDFGRATIEARRYFLMHERPDSSGRHVLSLSTDLGFTGSDTPIFENFFAGGYTTLRGFYFREASPRSLNVLVGGRFQWINSVEYMFPISPDDALRGVVFCDFGTVEREVELNSENFRVSPGAGIRVTIPALGPAPIALDLAFPVAHADGDRIQTVSFFVGLTR